MSGERLSPAGSAARTLARLLAGALLLAGCTRSSQATVGRGTEVVVFVDFSGSVKSDARALFEADLENQILPSLAAGDRLLVAAINDKTLSDFRPLVEATLPRKPEFNGWLDNVMKYNRETKDADAEVARVKQTVRTEIRQVLTRHEASPLTDIFSSLLIAQKLFHDEPRRKVLVLMSDMIEDYPPYHFEEIKWSPATRQKILADLDGNGLIPKLSGVCVYVSGVSGGSAALVENIGSFWQAYFKRAEADMDLSRYAHVLLHWPPPKSCRAQ